MFHLRVNMLTALAFVPETEVEASFETLIESERFEDEDLVEIIAYYSNNYVLGKGARGRRKSPKYEP